MHPHRPKPVHGWGELAREIAIIVVGIIIAIGLEQTVEFFHHNHQREELEAALQRDGKANTTYLKDDMLDAEVIVDWAQSQAEAVERAGPTGPLILRRKPDAGIGAPDAGVWPSAKASGLTNLLPPSAQNWLEYLAEEFNDTFTSSASATGRLYAGYAALDQDLVGRAAATRSGDLDLTALTPAQRALVVEHLRAIAEHARDVLRQLIVDAAGNEFILTTPLGQLDTPAASVRYARIHKAMRQAYPAAGLSFAGR